MRIFGSCATGLSLPTSDIDLGITGFESHSKNELIYFLNNLANVLEKFNWVKSIERILTANIPLIKIVIANLFILINSIFIKEVDPFIDFTEFTGGEDNFKIFEGF